MQSTQSGHKAQALTTVYRLTKSILTWISQITSETLDIFPLVYWLLDLKTSLQTGDTKKKPWGTDSRWGPIVRAGRDLEGWHPTSRVRGSLEPAAGIISEYNSSVTLHKDHQIQQTKIQDLHLNLNLRDFPGGPVAISLSSQCRGPRFDACSGS